MYKKSHLLPGQGKYDKNTSPSTVNPPTYKVTTVWSVVVGTLGDCSGRTRRDDGETLWGVQGPGLVQQTKVLLVTV